MSTVPPIKQKHPIRRRLWLSLALLYIIVILVSWAMLNTASSLSDFALGQAFWRYNNGDFPEAITGFTEAITLNPDNAAAYYNRGLVYAGSGDYESAIVDYDRVLEIHPDTPFVIVERGHARRNLKQLNEALQDYTHAHELRPADAMPIYWRVVTYQLMDNNAEAIADFEQFLSLYGADDDRAVEVRRWITHLSQE